MDVRQIPPVQETRVIVPKEDPPARPSVSKEGKPSSTEGPPPAPDRVGATLGAADTHELAEHIAEIINEAMRALQFSLNFEPDYEDGDIRIKVLDGEGNLIRQIPLYEFQGLKDKLSTGNVEGGILTNQVVP
jgi:uncharacterized FlaG/YvyC family protein